MVGILAGLGCAGSKPPAPEVKKPPLPIEEKLIEAKPETRPDWTIKEPETIGEHLVFIGLSGKFTMEKDARDDAHRDAINKVVRYISTDVHSKFERLIVSTGLSSEVIDPTTAIRDFEQQLSEAVTRRVKASQWYIEKWQQKQGSEVKTYHLVYLLAKVPQTEVDKVIAEQQEHQAGLLSAGKELARAKNLLLEADSQAVAQPVQAMAKYQAAIKQAEGIKIKTATYPELANLKPQAESIIKTAREKMAVLLNDPETIFIASVLGLSRELDKPITVAVAKVTYQETDLSSEFASYLIQKLEEAMSQEKTLYTIISQPAFQDELKKGPLPITDCILGKFNPEKHKIMATINALLFARYWERQNEVEIKLELIEVGQGTLLGSTSVAVPKTLFPPGIAYFPANESIAQQGLSFFTPDQDETTQKKDFMVKVWADKGEGALYKKDEIIKFHFRADKDCYIYLYHMDAAGQVKLLFPNSFNRHNLVKANRTYTIPDETMNFDLKITPPFGAEMIKAVASLQPLRDMNIQLGETGFRNIGKITDANTRRVITRSIEAIPREGYAENTCIITTIK